MCQTVQSDSPLRRARARHSTKSVQARFADKYGLDRCRSTAIHPRGWHEAKCRALLQRCRILNADRGGAHSSIRGTGQADPIVHAPLAANAALFQNCRGCAHDVAGPVTCARGSQNSFDLRHFGPSISVRGSSVCIGSSTMGHHSAGGIPTV